MNPQIEIPYADLGTAVSVKLPLTAIKIDPLLQVRVRTDPEVVDRYAERMGEGESFQHLTVVYDGEHIWLADGFHRLAAYEKLGRVTDIPCWLWRGSRTTAFERAVRLNGRNGVPLTAEDRHRAVRLALTEFGMSSTREIAKLCGIRRSTVEDIRQGLNPEAKTATRRGADGKSYSARKSRAAGAASKPKARSSSKPTAVGGAQVAPGASSTGGDASPASTGSAAESVAKLVLPEAFRMYHVLIHVEDRMHAAGLGDPDELELIGRLIEAMARRIDPDEVARAFAAAR